MKNHYLLLLFLFPLIMQSQDILWEKTYGGIHADYLFDAQPTADYGFILAGSSLSDKTGNKEGNNNGDLDYWIWKMSETGDLDWQKSFGGSGFDVLQSIKNTRDGGFILAGTSNSTNDFQKKDPCKGGTDFWVIKLDATGTEQWQRTIGGTGQDELLCAFQTRDGGYMLGGSSSSSPEITEDLIERSSSLEKPDLYNKSEKSRGNMDYWIIKLDKTGTIEWQKTYGGEYADILRSMEQTIDGGYILGGYSNSPESGDKTEALKGIGDYWILKIDNIGAIEWQNSYGGNGDNQLYVIHQTLDGGYIAGGNSNSTSPLTSLGGIVSNGTDYWVLKLDEKGAVVWSKTYDFGKTDILTSLIENTDGTYLVGGYSQSENISREGIIGKATGVTKKNKEEGYIALKIDEKGEKIWEKIIGSNGEDVLQKLFETRDGGYLMAGTSKSSTSKNKNSSIGGNDFWVVKVKDQLKPDKLKRKSIEVIPNPVVTYTNIIIGYEYETGTATVVDMAGRILQQFNISGKTIPVDFSYYAEGIYVINIKTNVQSDGVKVIRKGKN
ncbi:putative secreted protein (Por secretion system target) [Flavobacterium sp. 90]|uniref:T9SS type A sorting domain-containing protein n=1 Tax=unclassified Flavobacterium TaxID=196869 RepID=UPI000EB04F33|nr:MULTISPECIES: T9SS type A sorting domain-containing protein [unclassified Flavobacterium]RKR09651.1 putative secreted protein (Por secretion system target) [Flavobacterium sp. 81]TCK53436.1 putative secreted protein (Por secretion system target) [Flavobacterium sp. 90]